MPDYPIAPADVAAATDFLDQVADQSDSMEAETALDFRLELERLKKKCADVISDIDTQLKRVLEGNVERHGRRYYKSRKKTTVRFEHGKIAGRVIKVATEAVQEDFEDMAGRGMTPGEKLIATRTAQRSVDLMQRLYVTDSTDAKIGALNSLGLSSDRKNPKSVRTWHEGEEIIDFAPTSGGR